MNEETMAKIALILGVSEDSVTALPDEVRNAMVSAAALGDTDNEENAVRLYETLYALWTKGMVEINLREIAEHTGIDLTALHSLDDQAKHSLIFEYAVDSTNIDRFYEIVQKSLAVRDLPAMAELLGVSVDTLTALPIDTQERMCGHYAFIHEENGDHTALADELREMMQA